MQINKVNVVKNANYTTVNNSINFDKRASLKIRGLLFLVMSLPHNWDFTIKGLISILPEGKDAVYNIISEAIKLGYCSREEVRDGGKFKGYNYTFYEISPSNPFWNNLPYPGFPDTVKPDTDKPDAENPPQINPLINSNFDAKKIEGGIKEANSEKNPSPGVLLWLKITGEKEIPERGEELINKKVTGYLGLWEEVLEGWLASGWSVNNIDGQIEKYKKRVKNFQKEEEEVTPAPPPPSPEKLKEDEEIRRLMFTR